MSRGSAQTVPFKVCAAFAQTSQECWLSPLPSSLEYLIQASRKEFLANVGFPFDIVLIKNLMRGGVDLFEVINGPVIGGSLLSCVLSGARGDIK